MYVNSGNCVPGVMNEENNIFPYIPGKKDIFEMKYIEKDSKCFHQHF